jgi:c-di-GMP-binding flagellar brake protein YcgR
MTPDRRRINRWEVKREAKIKLEGAQAYTQGQIFDINLKGAQITLPLKLPKDKFIRLVLELADDFTLNLEVWVAWHKTIDGHNLYGLYFTQIKDADKEKIYQFVRRNFPEQMAKQWWKGFEAEEGGETMSEAKFEDRRVFERFAVRFPVRFLNREANEEGIAQTQDLSAKGMGLVSDEALPVNAALEIWLQLPDQPEPLYTRGEVVWSSSTGPDEYRAGVNLEKADLMGLARVLRAT